MTRNERLEILGSQDGIHWTTLTSMSFEKTPGVTPPEGSVLISAVDMAEAPGGSAVVTGWVDTMDSGWKTFLYRVSVT